MITVRNKSAEIRFDKKIYGEQALRAAEAGFAARAHVQLAGGKSPDWVVTLRPKGRVSAKAVEKLALEFLNETLNHQCRQETLGFNRPLTAPVLATVFERGFLCVPWDPLEEMDAELRAARDREIKRLMDGKP